MNENFNAGDIVESLAGHDSGRYFVIISTDRNFAQIANGKLRKLEKPKRKKLRHLKDTGYTYEQLTGEAFKSEKLTNPKLKKAIAEFKNLQNN